MDLKMRLIERKKMELKIQFDSINIDKNLMHLGSTQYKKWFSLSFFQYDINKF